MNRSLLLLIFTIFVFIAISQNPAANRRPSFIKEYAEADNYYHLALNKKNRTDAQEEQWNRLALEKFTSFLNHYIATRQPYDSLIFFAYLKCGELEHYFEQFPQALNYYKQAIGIKKQLPMVSDSFLFKPYIFSGLIFYQQNKLDSAIFSFKAAEQIQSRFKQKLTENERLYNNLGSVYYEYGNYLLAKNYFSKAIEALEKSNISYHSLYTNYRINLATTLFKLEEYDTAKSMYQSLLKQGVYLNQIFNNLGLIEFYQNRPLQAINYFQKAKYNDAFIIGLYNDMANAYLNLKQNDSTIKYLQLAEEKNRLFNNHNTSIDYGRTLKLKGDLAMTNNNFKLALQYYQQSLHQFYPSFIDTSLSSNPVNFVGAFSYINLFQSLLAKATTAHGLYQKSGKIHWAELELQTYKDAFALLNFVEWTYESDEARLFLEKTKYQAHTKPIDIAYQLYEKTKDKKFLNQLYFFDQQNKATVLSLNKQLKQELSIKNAPLLQKVEHLKTQITRLSLKAMELKNDSASYSINNRIRDLEIDLGKVQEQITATGIVNNLPSVTEIQKDFLDNKSALISFHLTGKTLTTILITQNIFEGKQLDLPLDFHQAIIQIIGGLKNDTINDTLEKSIKEIYSLLIGKLSLNGINRLIIIPDDELNYLPFEALQKNNGRYLIQDYAIQYQYSTALLKKQNTDFKNHNTLAFAPFVRSAFNDSAFVFNSLPNSLNEIKNLRGQKFIDSKATKENFLNNLSSYKVVHLATHASVNDSDNKLSLIAFYPTYSQKNSDRYLYETEIYQLPLNKSDLVILSACETGGGNLVKGEGIMSLSRAFAYAGCSNIITSLWLANDYSTAYLTTKFHFYLDKNYSIDEALRSAKLDYLNDPNINPRLKHASYWSHLVFIGNYQPHKTFSLLIPLLALLFIGAAIIWLRKT